MVVWWREVHCRCICENIIFAATAYDYLGRWLKTFYFLINVHNPHYMHCFGNDMRDINWFYITLHAYNSLLCSKSLQYILEQEAPLPRRAQRVRRAYSWCILYDISREKICCWLINHFYVIGHESYRIRRNNANYTAITPFKVIEGHRFWYQSKAHIRLPISD